MLSVRDLEKIIIHQLVSLIHELLLVVSTICCIMISSLCIVAPVDSLEGIDLRPPRVAVQCATLEELVAAFEDFMYVSVR